MAGRFIADAVERLRGRGIDVEVVSPADFPHFGLAYGSGIVGNLRRRPWLGLLVPLFLLSFAVAAVRAARGADLVHAHWLPSAAVALLTRKPVVAQVWGTDVELARRVPWLARAVLRRARLVVAPSTALAESARALGAREVRVIPSGVDVPETIGEEDEPPFVLYAGRLSPEKGVLELVEAADGFPLVIVGDGPLRERVPGARGFVPHDELLRSTRAQPSSPCRRTAKASASSAPRRWRTAGRSSRARSAACSTSSRTARRVCTCRPATFPRCARRSSACSPTARCASAWARQGARECASGSPGTPSPTRRSRPTRPSRADRLAPVTIPITKPLFGEEELRAVQRPLETGWVVQGPFVAEFEEKFAAYTGAEHAVATSSCSTALQIAMVALDVGPGDEVIVPGFTWVATANVVAERGGEARVRATSTSTRTT